MANEIYAALQPLGFESAGNLCFGTWKGYAVSLRPFTNKVFYADVAVRLPKIPGGLRKTLGRALREPGLKLGGVEMVKKNVIVASLSFAKADDPAKRFAEFLDKLTGALRGTRVLASLADRAEEAAVQKYGSEDYKALDPELRKTFVKVVNQDLSDCLPRVKQPTLLLWGEKDDATPMWMAQRMEKEIPDCGLVVLQGGTHFAYLEQIGRFSLITRQFLLGA